MELMTVLKPKFYDRFKCKIGDCKDTCCYGWQIAIDEQTYKKYKKLKHPKFVNIGNIVTRDKRTTIHHNFAKVKLDKDRKCPLLDSNKGCIVHSELGEDYLGSLCRQFPRVYNKYNGYFEKSLQLTCEATVKLLLEDANPIEFDMVDETRLTERESIIGNNLKDEFTWELRSLLINVIQDRTMPIEDRILKCFLVLNKISSVELNELSSSLENMLGLKGEDISDLMDKYKVDDKLQLELFKFITDTYALARSSDTYKNMLINSYIQLGLVNGNTEANLEKYKDLKIKYLRRIKGYEYILEHYMVMRLFSVCYPRSFANCKNEFFKLLLEFFTLRNFLIILSDVRKDENNMELLEEYISAFSRHFHNESKLYDKVIGRLKEININSLEAVFLMLK